MCIWSNADCSGADVNQKVDDDGVDGLSSDQTPLYAIDRELFNIAWRLISAGADLAYVDETGSAFAFCCDERKCHTGEKDTIDPKVDVNINAFEIGSPMEIAMRNDNKEIADLLLDDKRFNKESTSITRNT